MATGHALQQMAGGGDGSSVTAVRPPFLGPMSMTANVVPGKLRCISCRSTQPPIASSAVAFTITPDDAAIPMHPKGEPTLTRRQAGAEDCRPGWQKFHALRSPSLA